MAALLPKLMSGYTTVLYMYVQSASSISILGVILTRQGRTRSIRPDRVQDSGILVYQPNPRCSGAPEPQESIRNRAYQEVRI
jgi:hypothetical protein